MDIRPFPLSQRYSEINIIGAGILFQTGDLTPTDKKREASAYTGIINLALRALLLLDLIAYTFFPLFTILAHQRQKTIWLCGP